jgi:hypothetical protein
VLLIVIVAMYIPCRAGSAVKLIPRIEQNSSTGWLYLDHDIRNGERSDLDEKGFEQLSVPRQHSDPFRDIGS